MVKKRTKKGAPKKGATSKRKKPTSKKGPTKSVSRKAKAKRVAPKTRPKGPTKNEAVATPKSFAEKIRDCDTGTGIWFVVAGSVEQATILTRASDGSVVILTDAGVTEVVPMSNLFETANDARAARHR